MQYLFDYLIRLDLIEKYFSQNLSRYLTKSTEPAWCNQSCNWSFESYDFQQGGIRAVLIRVNTLLMQMHANKVGKTTSGAFFIRTDHWSLMVALLRDTSKTPALYTSSESSVSFRAGCVCFFLNEQLLCSRHVWCPKVFDDSVGACRDELQPHDACTGEEECAQQSRTSVSYRDPPQKNSPRFLVSLYKDVLVQLHCW